MIYFDAAATTFQKPKSVSEAVQRAMGTMSSPGRGNYASAGLASEVLLRCRMELAELFGADDPEGIVFTSNATHGLNIAIHSLVRPGGRVVISGYEHNAVTRPLYAVEKLSIHVVNTPLFQPKAMLEGFDRLVTPETDAVICTHVSNVFGYILPIREIAELCRRRKVPLILDASQSAGSVPVDQRALQADFIAMPGHKGLYGPQGTGVLICRGDAKPLLRGGTGSNSLEQEMPEFLPDRLEAGTHNVPGVAGLLEGVRFVRKLGVEEIGSHAYRLKQQLALALKGLPDLEVFSADDPALQGGVLSFRPKGADVGEICEKLGGAGFALRSGFHCAPFAHQTAGTVDTGTIRFSVSAFNSGREVDALAAAVKKFTK